MKNPTHRDIARAAGVSLATVSYALRNDPQVSAATCLRIQKIAHRLGYRSNAMVSALMAHVRAAKPVKYQSTICYLTTFAERYTWRKYRTYQQFYGGAVDRAAQAGYQVEHMWLWDPALKGRSLSKILLSRGIRGVIIADQSPPDHPPQPIPLEWKHFAVAYVGHPILGVKANFAMNDHYGTVTLALKELTKLGYRRIGYAISLHIEQIVEHRFLAAYLFYQQALPGSSRVAPLVTHGVGPDSLVDWFEAEKPDVIVTVQPNAQSWLEAGGYAVPKDVALAQLDWKPEMRGTAGVFQNNEKAGSAAVDMVVGQIQRNEYGPPNVPKLVLISGSWKSGASAPRRGGH